METEGGPPGSRSQTGYVGADVASIGKQHHVTPKTKKTAIIVNSRQQPKRLGRRCKKSNGNNPSTPGSDEETRADVCRKPISKKSGRILNYPSSATQNKACGASDVAGERADSVENFRDRTDETRHSGTPSRSTHRHSVTPVHDGSQSFGRTPAKTPRRPLETEDPSSEKKPGSKRRRLYSQPVGVIEPAGSVSGSQSCDNPSTALVLRPKPSDTASRANESVYDLLLEHTARKSNLTGRSKKVPCGRKSAPARVRSVAAASSASAAVRSSPRPPRRRAAAAAASHLRDVASENDENANPIADRPPEGTPQSEISSPQVSSEVSPEVAGGSPDAAEGSPDAAKGSPEAAEGSPEAAQDSPDVAGDGTGAEAAVSSQDDTADELERGTTEVFYMPTVVRSDDDSSDEQVPEERAAPSPERGQAAHPGGRATSEETVTERDSIWPTSDPDWEPNVTAQSSPEESEPIHQEQRQCASETQQPDAASDESTSPVTDNPVKPAQNRRSRHHPSTPLSSRDHKRSSGRPSWMGGCRETSKTPSRTGKPACYSRARRPSPVPSPDRSLRRYSYLSGNMPERRYSAGRQEGRSRSRSGSRGRGDTSLRSGTRRSGRSSHQPSPRRAARPFFTVDPDTESPSGVDVSPSANGASTSAAEPTTSDSVSQHVLAIEQDPCWYRHPRREIGPNISSETSSTRRQQARPPPRHPRRKEAPWTYGPEGPDSQWEERQPGGQGPWRHSLVPTTLQSRPSGAPPRPGSAEFQPSRGAGQPGAAPPSGFRWQPDLEEPDPAAAESGRRESTGSPEQVDEEATSGDFPEPEQMDAAPVAEQDGGSVGEHPVPSDPRPVPSDTRPEPPENLPALSSQPVQSPGPQRDQSGPYPVKSSSRTILTEVHPVPPAAHSITPSPATFSWDNQALFSSQPVTTSSKPTIRGPQAVPTGSQPTTSDHQPFPPDPQPFASQRSQYVPQTILPDPKPFPSGPQPFPSLAAHPSDGTLIGSELARLVLRWRQLAKLEQHTFSALRTAQRRQQELLNVQKRLRCARLDEGKRARAGILAACDVLERLCGGA